MFLKARMKKLTVWILTISALQIVYLPCYADDSTAATPIAGPSAVADTTAEGYLQLIAQYTNGTMIAVNNIPAYLTMITTAILAWFNPDTTTTSANLQGAFTNYYTSLTQSTTTVPLLATPLVAGILNGANSNTLPNANDLTYLTVLGAPFLTPDPRAQGGNNPVDPIYNYIQNASGGGLSHAMPGSNWNGSPGDQAKYNSFYNTITAVETYNAYILSQLVTDNLASLSTNQKALTDMADGSNFFSQVASETVGVVLRQILMFESQSFIVLTQMLEVQKQLLASQAMTNTMLMNTGTTTEQILLRKAIVKTAS
jgi:hypothetical protein